MERREHPIVVTVVQGGGGGGRGRATPGGQGATQIVAPSRPAMPQLWQDDGDQG